MAKKNIGRTSTSKVILVSPEYPGITPSGGIGTAFKALAEHMGEEGFDVTFLIPTFQPLENLSDSQENLGRNHKIVNVSVSEYVWSDSVAARSYGVFRWIYDLVEADQIPVAVHFPEYQGLGFYTIEAKATIPAFKKLKIVVQTHGPTEWTLELNKTPITNPNLNLQIHMEKESIKGSDFLVSPSQYMVDWLKNKNYLDEEVCVKVLKNLPGKDLENYQKINKRSKTKSTDIREIIYFGRHEERKGIRQFLEAISASKKLLSDADCLVSFVGPLGMIGGMPSVLLICEESKNWEFEVSLISHLDRSQALDFLAKKKNALVVVPSNEENLPYTVYEVAALGMPMISSSFGGGKELLSESHSLSVFPMDMGKISNAIEIAITDGHLNSSLGFSIDELKDSWTTFQNDVLGSPEFEEQAEIEKSLTVVITHYERPEELLATLVSFINQSNQNFNLIVVDDCSTSANTIRALDGIRRLIDSAGWTFVRNNQNSYLGASRNAGFKKVTTSHIVFFDDDDRPDHDFVNRILESIIDFETIVIPLNITQDEFSSTEIPTDKLLQSKISYIPTRGPLINAVLENNFGSSVSVIPTNIFEKIGGYSELKGIGHEDYEFYLMAALANIKIRILPLPIYLYRPTTNGMISSTNGYLNYRRSSEHFVEFNNQEIAKDFLMQNVMARAKENIENRQTYISQRKYGEKYWFANNLGRGDAPREVADFLLAISDEAPVMKAAGEWLHKWISYETQNFENTSSVSAKNKLPLESTEISFLSNFVSEIVINAVQNTKIQIEESPAFIGTLVSRMQEDECEKICKTLELLNTVQVSDEETAQDTYNWLTILSASSILINHSTRISRFKFADSFEKAMILMDSIISDAGEYVQNNQDLIGLTAINEQIRHFVENGRQEQRDGFRGSISLMKMLGELAEQPLLEFLSQKLDVSEKILNQLLVPSNHIALKRKAQNLIVSVANRKKR